MRCGSNEVLSRTSLSKRKGRHCQNKTEEGQKQPHLEVADTYTKCNGKHTRMACQITLSQSTVWYVLTPPRDLFSRQNKPVPSPV